MPEFKSTRLLSVIALARAGYSILFKDNYALCMNESVTIFKAVHKHGTYIVGETAGAFAVQDDSRDFQATIPPSLKETDTELRHRRLAHTNYRDIDKLEKASIGMRLKSRIVPVGKHTLPSRQDAGNLQ